MPKLTQKMLILFIAFFGMSVCLAMLLPQAPAHAALGFPSPTSSEYTGGLADNPIVK